MRAKTVLTRLAPHCFYYAGHLMSWKIIHDDDVAATEGWCEALFDVREEDGAVHRSINHEGSDNPVVAQAGDESDCFPMSMRNRCDQPLSARATTSKPHHVCAGSGLVDKHQPSGSRMPCSRIQRRRARATSPRFCSAACRLFFKADIVSIKETLESAPTAGDALFSHGGDNLLEGQIRLFGNHSQDPVRVLFQWRNTPAAPFRRRAPCLTPALAPSNYRTNAHLEFLGYLPPRPSAFDRFNRTLTQVRGIRLGIDLAPQANQFPQICLGDSGWESLRSMPMGNALAGGSLKTPSAVLSPLLWSACLGGGNLILLDAAAYFLDIALRRRTPARCIFNSCANFFAHDLIQPQHYRLSPP